MTILYLSLGVTNVKNLKDCIVLLKRYAAETSSDSPNDIMIPSLKLKARMLL
jgi:hypothetical protein